MCSPADRSPSPLANSEQAERWDGPGGEHWVAEARHYERANAPHGRRLIEAAAITAGEHVLDFGCGAGGSTLAAAEHAAPGTALGIDLSRAMLDLARRRARERGIENVSFVRADAQVHRFEPESFEVALSRFGSMFFADPPAAFTNLASALHPGGRLALISWRELADNEWILNTRRALAAGRDLPAPSVGEPGMFGLAEPEHVERVLAAAGFAEIEIVALDLAVVLGENADDASAFIARSRIGAALLEDLAGARRAAALERLHASLAARETPDGVALGSGAWLTTARRG